MWALFLFALLLECLSITIGALPDGFIVETVTSEAKGTTGIFAPHPASGKKPSILLIVEKNGKVSVVENPDESPDTRIILNLAGKTCTDGERGLQSITIHPNFATNRFVYLFYAEYIEGCPDSITEGTWNVVNRFVMNPMTLELDYDSREEIWRSSRLRYNIHNGGAMDFGNDGKLYITTGDSGKKTLTQSLDNTLGSIIRLNDDGTVPEDNPYTRANGWEGYRCADTDGRVPTTSKLGICAEVFAHGFRNPFRMRMDPMETEKVRFSISDVGGAYWEDLSIGGTDYAARNYGWPNWEGPCRESSLTNCPIPDDGFAVEPYHYYEHRTTREGAAAAGSAFVPPGLWPSEYKFLFVDFIFLEIYNLIEDPEKECRLCTPPVSGYRNETFFKSIQEEDQHVNNARMVDIFFGPYKDTQALYVIRFGDHDTVLRIRYNDIVDNAPPIADFKVPDLNFAIGANVQFNGSVSSDPEGDDLAFEWDFGDSTASNEMNPSHQFNDLGEYDVVLKVTDSYGQMQQKTETILVGIPPNARIISPVEGDVFYVGELLQLKGEAYDHTGARLDDTYLSWEVRKHHAEHFHPFMDLTIGNDLTLYPAPEPEDYFATTNSYLQIILVATDKDGLTTEIDRIVKPSLVVVEVESNPQGLTIVVDDNPVTKSETTISWKEHNLRLEVEDQESYTFKSWSDGSTARERTIKLSEGIHLVHANFCKAEEQSCLKGEECCSDFCVINVCRSIVDLHVVGESAKNITEQSVTQSATVPPTVNPPSGNLCKVDEQSCLKGEECCSDFCVINVCRSIVDLHVVGESANNITEQSITQIPTITSTTEVPSIVLTTQIPTTSPTTDVPSIAPITQSPTISPTTDAPSIAPITRSPTISPTTDVPSIAPITQSPTVSPTMKPSSADLCKADEKRCLKGEECCSDFCIKNFCRSIVDPASESVAQSPSKSPSTDEPSIAPKFRPSTAVPTTKAPSIAPAFQEPEPFPISGKDTIHAAASVILSFVIAIFVLAFVPYMVFEAQQQKREKKINYIRNLALHESGFKDGEGVENRIFDDCSFNNMNLTMMDGDFD